MSKQLCDLKNLPKKDLNEYAKYVRDPTHICTKCGRAANNKKYLCHAVKMPSS